MLFDNIGLHLHGISPKLLLHLLLHHVLNLFFLNFQVSHQQLLSLVLLVFIFLLYECVNGQGLLSLLIKDTSSFLRFVRFVSNQIFVDDFRQLVPIVLFLALLGHTLNFGVYRHYSIVIFDQIIRVHLLLVGSLLLFVLNVLFVHYLLAEVMVYLLLS